MAMSVLTILTILSLSATVLTEAPAALSSNDTSTLAPVITTTTVRPSEPTGDPPTHKWALFDDHNVSCILLQAGIRMSFNLTDKTGKPFPELRKLDIPDNETLVKVSGSCAVIEDKQTISLIFNDDWALNVTFTRNTTTNKYIMSHVSLTYETSTVFPDAQLLIRRKVQW